MKFSAYKIVIDLFRPNPERKKYGREFLDFLHTQGKMMQRPLEFVAIFAWVDFAFRTDPALHPEFPDLFFFRMGLTAVGLIAFMLTFFDKMRGKGLGILHVMLAYTLLTCSYFTGRMADDANYVSGLQIVIMIAPFVPFKLTRIYIYYLISIALFLTGVLLFNPSLTSPSAHYSMNNLIITYVLGFVLAFILDRTRFNIFITQYKLKLSNIDLENELKNVKTLRGLLPICASCKRIKDDKGYWSQVETYLADHAEVEFSHGLCQECADKLYGNEKWYKRK